MYSWQNIEVSSDDPEIIAIDHIEQSIGNIPNEVYEVRELITRFEVCHFKYQRHFQNIIESIAALSPTVEVKRIGDNHPRNGKDAVKKDKTGRSLVGQHYISALSYWLDDVDITTDDPQKKISDRVISWLGDKNETKERLVRLLLARLLDPEGLLEEYVKGEELEELEYHVMATDICSYAFPSNFELVIKAIGSLKPVEDFDGCGTYNSEIKSFINSKFNELCHYIRDDLSSNDLNLGEKTPIKIWLVACLAKTFKEQIKLTDQLPI
jgi:hypothetical protein